MPKPENLRCVVSGSFKFKPEIDQLHEELTDNGMTVLAPDRGWLPASSLQVIRFQAAGFRPLPSEQGKSAGEIEEAFLGALDQSDFMYLNNLEGYIGIMAALETGYALAGPKPIYAREPIELTLALTQDWERPGQLMLLRDYVRVVPIPGITEDFYSRL